MLVGVGQGADVAVLRRERMAEPVDDAVVAHVAARGPPGGAEQVLGQPERSHGLEHGDLDQLALARSLAVVEGAQHGDGEVEPRRLVGDQARQEARRQAVHARLEGRGAAHALHEIVERRLVAVGPAPRVAERVGVHDRRVDLLEVLVAQAQALDGLRTAVVDEEVGAPDQVLHHRHGPWLFQVEADRAFVAVGRE